MRKRKNLKGPAPIAAKSLFQVSGENIVAKNKHRPFSNRVMHLKFEDKYIPKNTLFSQPKPKKRLTLATIRPELHI